MLNLLYLVVGCLLGFSGSFRACFFAMQISLLHQFALARFRFVLFRCLFFCLKFTYAHNAINQEVHRDGHGGQRGSFGGKGRGRRGVRDGMGVHK